MTAGCCSSGRLDSGSNSAHAARLTVCFCPPLGGAVSLVCYALHSHELRVVSAEKRDDVEG